MAVKNRRLLSDDDSEKFCEHYCLMFKYSTCPSDCRSKCTTTCLKVPVSIPPPDFPIHYSESDHPSKSPQKLSPLITCTVALLSFTFLLVLAYAAYVKFFSGRTNRRSEPQREVNQQHQEFLDEDHGPVLDHPIWYIRTIGLPPAVINAITVCKFKTGDGLIDGTECSVCLSEFEEDETLRLLPKCSHAFHLPCIDTWLRSHTNCPMCRAPIVSETSRVPLADSSAANSAQSEQNEEEISQRYDESHGVEEEAVLGFSTVIEVEDELHLPNDDERERTDNSDEGGVGGIQPKRRSVSLDSLSALKISSDLASLQIQSQLKVDTQTNLGQNQEINPLNTSKRLKEPESHICSTTASSSEKSQQDRPIAMKRSVSWSGKFLLRNSTQRSNTINHSSS